MIDVSDTELSIIKTILQKHLQNQKVWVFGSRSNGTARKYSDLDLAIEFPNKQSFNIKDMLSLQSDFSESDLPWEVDVVDYNSVTDEFRTVIDNEKQPLLL